MVELTKEEKRELLQQLATPPDFWSVVNAEFDFQIDVCAGEENHKCELFICKELDALSLDTDWVDCHDPVLALGEIVTPCTRAWCNPGFAKVMPWHQKAYAEAQKHPSAVVVLIGLPGGSQDWWRFAYEHATQVRILGDRVQYIPPAGIEDKGNSRESWLFIYRRKVVPCPAQIVHDDWRARLAGGDK